MYHSGQMIWHRNVAYQRRCSVLLHSTTQRGHFMYTVYLYSIQNAMIKQDVYFWQIRWAGRWMTTYTRFSEDAIKCEHPEALRIDDSREVRMVPETPMEKVFAHFKK